MEGLSLASGTKSCLFLVSRGADVYYGCAREGLIMKRFAVLSCLLTAGAVSMVFAHQQQQQRPPAPLEIQKVKDNLYVITGGGGNTAAFITDKGVVIVDTKV